MLLCVCYCRLPTNAFQPCDSVQSMTEGGLELYKRPELLCLPRNRAVASWTVTARVSCQTELVYQYFNATDILTKVNLKWKKSDKWMHSITSREVSCLNARMLAQSITEKGKSEYFLSLQSDKPQHYL